MHTMQSLQRLKYTYHTVSDCSDDATCCALQSIAWQDGHMVFWYQQLLPGAIFGRDLSHTKEAVSTEEVYVC